MVSHLVLNLWAPKDPKTARENPQMRLNTPVPVSGPDLANREVMPAPSGVRPFTAANRDAYRASNGMKTPGRHKASGG